ncbi:carboxylesterase/lipase family protein [Paenibacillus silvae]|jgi:para-nitrobenzyl esterase|uniref:carboxylesterase/lipase family protein n=1 Tax=Paenibacillus TaxID=44249 RepID=UPI001C10C0AC|nr:MULTISPECIES: carboxylesterase/lipase family protein [Paenibacillus]MBU5353024.1 carboxylesterase/lipase family protein [Paenibacillus barcinonensis]MDM5280860.1 carboxylesterase/lipase family protein [Paenibacillus silvae]
MRELQVQTKYGKVQGELLQGASVWKGIPYAKPPVGELRFRAPVQPESWDGIRQATEFGPENIQPRHNSEEMAGQKPPESEDSLYLNIWAPEKESGHPLPVMVWIHGGSFVTGSGSLPVYDGTQLAVRGDVIVVTINYRLGPLGFLHMAPLGQGFVSNAGLLDQVAALQWVKENITAFGGDPNQVTVFGESAGSMSIAALMAMPSAKGLFQRAIMESGASQFMPAEQASALREGTLKMLGVDRDNLQKLNIIPVEQIMAAAETVKQQSGAGMALLFQPVLDGETLPQIPLQAVSEGSAKDIPILIGTTLHEGSLFIQPHVPYSKEIDMVQGVDFMTPDLENRAAIADSYPKTADGQAQAMTDMFFWRSALQYAAAQQQHAPVWMYRFDWVMPEHPLLQRAIHSIEIFFVFNTLDALKFMKAEPDEAAKALALKVQDAWIAFAKAGKPAVAGIEWPEYRQNRATLIFNHEIEVVHDPESSKRELLGV